MAEDCWPIEVRVSPVESAKLTVLFSPEEVGRAIAQMKASSASRPDGLPVAFFQRLWVQLQPVIMPMFHEFYIGTSDMSRLNFGVVTVIPKIVGATDIQNFRLITVINVLQRIVSKVCATQFAPLVERLSHPC